MAWNIPQYGRKDINIAGNCLIADNKIVWVANRDQMLEIINNWRSSHNFPLQIFKMTLLRRAKRADSKAIVAQRIKRLASIEAKLRRFPDMKLSQMQDLGGCRAIVENIRRVNRLVKMYQKGRSKNPTSRHEFIKQKNYIREPKSDGYRSVHLIYRYRSASKKHAPYNGLKIEIQLRSRLQHAWATAVETVALFTGQALKSMGGEVAWRRFFLLMSSAIALREKQPVVPGTPTDKTELVAELRTLASQLNVVSMLEGYRFAMRRLPAKNVTDAVAFLVVLDTEKYRLTTTGFKKEELAKASEAYLDVEKTAKPNIHAVLVSLSSVHAIRGAYPNFYLDTEAFIKAVRFAIR